MCLDCEHVLVGQVAVTLLSEASRRAHNRAHQHVLSLQSAVLSSRMGPEQVRGLAFGQDWLSDGGRGDAGSCCYWMDQLPDESDGGVLCVLPSMAGLEEDIRLVGKAVPRLRTRCRDPPCTVHVLCCAAGIRYPQLQMQAGCTGINSNRIYSPAKQVLDHDPQGTFLKKWVPELETVPDKYLAEPHTMPLDVQHECGCVIGEVYPAPIVDHKEAYSHARSRLASIKSKTATKQEAAEVHRIQYHIDLLTLSRLWQVYEKHGSRKRPSGSEGPATAKKSKRGSKVTVVSVASSGRAGCQICGELIERGAVRLGLPYQFRGNTSYKWVHSTSACFASVKVVNGVSELDGFDTLTQLQQDLLKSL